MDAGRITAGGSASAAQAIQQARAGRAYGPIRFADAVAQMQVAPVPSAGAVQGVQPDPRRSATLERNLERLIAGTTDVSARDHVGVPGGAPAPMSIYRHPADRNQAATGVAAGRMVDLKG